MIQLHSYLSAPCYSQHDLKSQTSDVTIKLQKTQSHESFLQRPLGPLTHLNVTWFCDISVVFSLLKALWSVTQAKLVIAAVCKLQSFSRKGHAFQ